MSCPLTNTKSTCFVFLSVALLLLGSASAFAQGGCQDQDCNWSGQCYTCGSGEGTGCSPGWGGCPQSCTEVRCEPTQNLTETKTELLDWLENGTKVNQNSRVDVSDELQVNLWQPRTKVPVAMWKATFGPPSDLFLGGELLNLRDSPIVSFRIGWRFEDNGGNAIAESVGVHQPVKVTDLEAARLGFYQAPGESVVLDKSFGESVRQIYFYVSEVEFRDGFRWVFDTSTAMDD